MFMQLSNATFNNILLMAGTIAGMAAPDIHPTMQRLYEAAEALHKIDGQSNVADKLGELPQTLNNWESRGISQRGAIKAAGILGCSAQWIISGKGGMAPRAIFSAELQSHLETLGEAEVTRCENMLRAHFGMEAMPSPKSHPNGMSGDRRAA